MRTAEQLTVPETVGTGILLADVAEKVTRLSINLSKDVATALRSIAKKHGITITEAVRRAISTQKYIEDAHDRHAKILIKEPDDTTLRELVFIR
jgi:hypothetical protein